MIAQSSALFAYDPSSRRERLVAGGIVALLVLGVLVAARFPSVPLGRSDAWVPAVDAVAFSAYALTAWMLGAQYRVRGYAPLAILAAAFAAIGVLQAAHLIFYPGLSGSDGTSLQTSPWMRLVGRTIFDLMVVGYAIADWRERREMRESREVPTVRRYAEIVWVQAAVLVVATIAIGGLVPALLPKLFDVVTGYTPLYRHIVFPGSLALAALAGFIVFAFGRRGSRLRVWLCVVLAAQCGYLITATLGESLYTSGFYISRAYDVICALTLVFAVQTQIVSILRRAQRTGERAHAFSQIIAVGDSQTYAGVNAMLTRVAREFAFDYVALSRAREGRFTIQFTYGSPGFPVGYAASIEESISQLAIESRSLYVVDDLTETQWSAQRERTEAMWASCCVLPIFTNEGLYGSVTFANARRRPQRLRSLERDFLQLTGILVGNAIERIRQKKRLDELAYYDALTGLPNRVLLIDRITTAIVAAERYGGHVSVHFLDLDSFKPINDRFGHAVGDVVLREVGRRLERSVRASDTVGRYGGDEFVVLQPMTATAQDSLELERRVADAFRRPVVVAEGSFDMSFSIGVSTYPDDGVDAHTLLIRADEAQYRAKDARKARRANPVRDPGAV